MTRELSTRREAHTEQTPRRTRSARLQPSDPYHRRVNPCAAVHVCANDARSRHRRPDDPLGDGDAGWLGSLDVGCTCPPREHRVTVGTRAAARRSRRCRHARHRPAQRRRRRCAECRRGHPRPFRPRADFRLHARRPWPGGRLSKSRRTSAADSRLPRRRSWNEHLVHDGRHAGSGAGADVSARSARTRSRLRGRRAGRDRTRGDDEAVREVQGPRGGVRRHPRRWTKHHLRRDDHSLVARGRAWARGAFPERRGPQRESGDRPRRGSLAVAGRTRSEQRHSHGY